MISGEFLNFIKDGGKFLIAGHEEPDGDCVGSQLALGSVLRRMGKEVIICSAGPFKRTEVRSYQDSFVTTIKNEDLSDNPRLIVVDCSIISRIGSLEPLLKGLPIAVIDHHDTHDAVKGTLTFIDPNAPSTTFLIRKLILALGLEPNQEEAELLFLGLCTDTGFFRFVDSDGAETFEAAAALVRGGADPKKTFLDINGGKSMDSRMLIARILIRAESLFEGKLVISDEEYEESAFLGSEGRDSDSFYQLVQSVANVEAIALIRQETPERCTVGLRSRSHVDVAKIAESFGGGGHKNAAGFSAEGTIESIKLLLIKFFEKVFSA